ncbi:hypothetical protein [Plantibacter sp. YIM 135249]|uniref:hypothetical protein n=1 Tax=Plantibacter sp. YIM 135249 TaxID=3423918 RepID=UPI003D34287D
MPPTTTDNLATLWHANTVPVRMVWHGERWRITDTPTALSGEPLYVPPMMTHPSSGFRGWRFQASNERGDSRMFDVLRDEGGWIVSRMYE